MAEQHLEFISLKRGCNRPARLSLFMSKCHIVGNLMSGFKIVPLLVDHQEPEKTILLGFLSTFWLPCSKCIFMCFKKDRGGC